MFYIFRTKGLMNFLPRYGDYSKSYYIELIGMKLLEEIHIEFKKKDLKNSPSTLF